MHRNIWYIVHIPCTWRSDIYKTWIAFYQIFLFTLHAQCDALAYIKLKWFFLSDFFTLGLRAQSDALTYTKLERLFYRIFCSHSAHKVTLRRILRLPTSLGLTQARPSNHLHPVAMILNPVAMILASLSKPYCVKSTVKSVFLLVGLIFCLYVCPNSLWLKCKPNYIKHVINIPATEIDH